MATFTETSTTQAAVVDRLTQPDLGWDYGEPESLERDHTEILIESEVVAALRRLNPIIAARPELVEEVLPKLRAVLLSVQDDGLIAANERMMRWLRGNETVHFVGEPSPTEIRLTSGLAACARPTGSQGHAAIESGNANFESGWVEHLKASVASYWFADQSGERGTRGRSTRRSLVARIEAAFIHQTSV